MRELTIPTSDLSEDVPQQLRLLGLNQIESSMAVPYMWFTPGASDPDSPVVLAIVKGLQNGLAKLGIPTRRDGYVDRRTRLGLERISGPTWKAKAWTQIYSEMIDALRAGRCPPPRKGRKNMYLPMGDLPRSAYNFTSAGTAYGVGDETHALFKDLQRQLNRLASLPGSGFGKVGEDGKIGGNTVAAVQGAENFIAVNIVPTYTQAGVAKAADRARDEFRYQANQRGASAKVSAPTSKKRSGGGAGAVTIDPSTGGLTTTKAGLIDELMTPTGLAIVGGSLLAFWYISQADKKPKKKPKKKARRKPARRKARRRVTYTWW